jgi:hypothetical protein
VTAIRPRLVGAERSLLTAHRLNWSANLHVPYPRAETGKVQCCSAHIGF